MSRDDGGIYVCTASNGVRSPAIARAKVRVNFAPTLEVYQYAQVVKIILSVVF